jgi:hypothetical protein
MQGGTRTNFNLRCLHNITSHDRCIIWLSIYNMIVLALGWIELKSAKIIIFHFWQQSYPYPWWNCVKTEIFRLLFWIDKILHNFDDIFILNLLKLLHLRKIKPISLSKKHPTITELHRILITCIHLNDNIICYPPSPSVYILIVVHKL